MPITNVSSASSASSSLASPSPLERSVVFAHPDLVVVIGRESSNAASAPGSATIVYESSNSEIATVDATGLVTGVSPGSATISASVPAEVLYQAATASYDLEVLPETLEVAAWLGEDDISVTFPESVQGFELFHSSDTRCTWINFADCAEGELNVLDLLEITDSRITLTHPGQYFLRRGDVRASTTLGLPYAVPVRYFHQIASFKGRLWLIGGTELGGTTQFKNDVWSSLDGKLWVRETAAAEFAPPHNHRLIVFKDQLWLIDGKNQFGIPDQIWSSINGVNWERRADVPFEARRDYALTVHNNALWVIGGRVSELGSYRMLNDAWSSTDGVNWIQHISASAAYRHSHTALSFKDRLWILGGYVGDIADVAQSFPLQETGIWSSADGVNWRREVENADLPAASQTQFIAHDNQLWYCGEYRSGRSSDGLSWAEIVSDFTLQQRCYLHVQGNDLWVLDNNGQRQGILNEDGITPYTYGYETLASNVVSFNGRMWMLEKLMDGTTATRSSEYYLWSSLDGLPWSLVNTDMTFAALPQQHQLVVFNNKLFIFAGNSTGQSSASAGIWSSPDGSNWTHEIANPDFGNRYTHPIIEFKEKLWLIGGEIDREPPVFQYRNDIWSSENGVDWLLVNEDPDFSGRIAHQLVATEDHLLVVGGSEWRNFWGLVADHTDIWATTDGDDWYLFAEDTGYIDAASNIVYFNGAYWQVAYRPLRGQGLYSSPDLLSWTFVKSSDDYNISDQGGGYDSLLVHEGKLFMFSRDRQGALAIWSSPDGSEWRRRVTGTLRFE